MNYTQSIFLFREWVRAILTSVYRVSYFLFSYKCQPDFRSLARAMISIDNNITKILLHQTNATTTTPIILHHNDDHHNSCLAGGVVVVVAGGVRWGAGVSYPRYEGVVSAAGG